MVRRIVNLLSRSAIGKRLVEDGQLRALLFACASMAINFAFAIFNGVVGAAQPSFWFVTLFSYYLLLAAMRLYAVVYGFRPADVRTGRAVMRFCGWGLCALAVVLSGAVCLTIAMRRDGSRDMIVMIAVAAYTFFKAGAAIYNIVKARRKRNPFITTLKNISCADAAMSMLILEHSMISTFGGGADGFAFKMDIATGAGAFLIVLALGVDLLVNAGRQG